MKKIENSFAVTGFVGKDALCCTPHNASYVVKTIMLATCRNNRAIVLFQHFLPT